MAQRFGKYRTYKYLTTLFEYRGGVYKDGPEIYFARPVFPQKIVVRPIFRINMYGA